MFELSYSNRCSAEMDWIATVILGGFLGIEFTVRSVQSKNVTLSLGDRRLEIAGEFFDKAADSWLQPVSLPRQPLARWQMDMGPVTTPITSSDIPVIFGAPGVSISDDLISLNLDIFGSCFFMLSRYEEVVKDNRDQFDRFPATAALAFQEGFLERPIVNEYVEILWGCMKHLWPELKRKKRSFRTLVSADVDIPYSPGTKSATHQIKQIGADLLIRRSPAQALRSVGNYLYSKRDDFRFDPYLPMFDWMMDVNEKAGNKIAFFFIAGHSTPTRDGCYTLDEPVIRKLLRHIHQRGHEIGLHPSFNSYLDSRQMEHEANNLREVMAKEGIEQQAIGGRQHYLRWRTPVTARNWEATGMAYDSTLGFAEQAGFRCGCCYEYPLYDVEQRRALSLRERPLIAMEASVFSHPDITDAEQAQSLLFKLKETCRLYNGDFTLLWHNSFFRKREWRDIYEDITSN